MPLIIKEVQMKTIMSYDFTPVRTAIIKKKIKRQQVLVRVWRNWNPCTLFEMKSGGVPGWLSWLSIQLLISALVMFLGFVG